jgi:hypothetical protein
LFIEQLVAKYALDFAAISEEGSMKKENTNTV